MDQLDEDDRDSGDPHRKCQPFCQQQRRQRHRLHRRIRRVVNAQRARRAIADHRGDQRRHERLVLDATQRAELESKHCAGQRRPENRAETAGRTRHQQLPAQALVETQALRQRIREAGAHLHRRAFAAGAATEHVGQYGADQHHRRQAQRQCGAIIVDGIDDQVVARSDRLPVAFVQPTDHEAGDRQGKHQLFVRHAQ